MRLRRIRLKNFKRFVDFQAQFSAGINVVKGPLNEMGKSTLLEGIIVALFHNPKSTAKELEAYSSWGSTRQFRTSLEFEEKGNGYLLEKDFDKGTTRLICDDTREELDTFKETSTKIAELLGTRSDDLFLCSSCIRQSEVSEISSGKKEITESLEEVVMGGKESTFAWQVVQKLDSKVAEMKKGLDKLTNNPGILASLKSKIQGTSQRYGEVKEEVSKVEARIIELVEVSRQLAEAKEQYENARALLEKNRQRKEIEASTQRLAKDYDGIEKLLGSVKKLREDSERAGKALGAIEGLRDKQEASELRRELDAIQNRREVIEKDLAQREEELAEAKRKLGNRKYVVFFGSGKGMVASIAALAGGVIGVVVGLSFLLSLIVLGAGLLAVSTWARIAVIRDKTNISVIEGRIQDMKETLDDLGRNERELLARAKCSTVAEFNEKERDFYDWLDKRNAADLQLKWVPGGKTIEEIKEQKAQVARKLATEEAKLTDDLKQTLLSPEQYVALERKVQSLEKRQAELEKQKSRCEIIIEQARFSIEDQIRLEEELEVLQEALKHEDKKVRVYGLASEFLSQARAEVLSSVEEALEKEIQKYLAIFTDDKYKQVKVDKEALEFWVYSDEKGDWAKPEELSGGAIDEFYLAFRLALAKLIFGDKKPPLMLDDPFVNFDSIRLANTLKFLKTLASDYQIIIFTLGDSYDKVADNIILLGEEMGNPSPNRQEGGD
ncbi:MAG: AAA family ATPase [Dehalococcoidia bacterium]|nr:AAA family ATPase [Dehalococcoidia bacterium]